MATYRRFGIAAHDAPAQLDLFAPKPDFVLEGTDLVERLAEIRVHPTCEPFNPNSSGLWHPDLYDGKVGSRSRVHQFPMIMHGGRVYLVHPALEGADWLGRVADVIGYAPVYDECVSQRRTAAEGWHANDLCTREGYRELLETRHFTTTEAITRAVALNLGVFNHSTDDIDAKIGRAMLEALGIPETGMADHDILIDAVHCHDHLRGLELQENAWDRVHAFERGLVAWDRQGNLKTVPLRAAA